MATKTVIRMTEDIRNDSRSVCVFCCHEAEDDYGFHCGEYGAIMTRAEYYEYTGEDFFAD